MDGLSVIKIEDLPNLRKLYEVDKPLHVATTNAIGHFMKRFEKNPEWRKIVTFWSLNDNNWRQTGTFVIINSHDDHILFNTLELSPYKTLRKCLNLIKYDRQMAFHWFRAIFLPVMLEVIRDHNLEITAKVSLRNLYQKYVDLNIDIDAPDGFYFDCLNQSHVEVIASMWYQEYAFRPREYISNCIAQNHSTGLFEKNTGKLVASTMMQDNGLAGNIFVVEKYRRLGFAELVMCDYAAKITKDGYEIVAHALEDNNASFQMATSMGTQWIDNHTTIIVRPRQPQNVLSLPLRGHL